MDREDFQQELLTQLHHVHQDIQNEAIKPDGSIDYEFLHKVYQVNVDFSLAKSKHPIACEKGCFYCCHLNVDTAPGEMEYILKRYRAEKGEGRYKELLQAGMDKYRAKQKAKPDNPEDFRAPCPFLQGTLCSIYEYRPLQCRSMNVADKQPCINAFNGADDQDTPFHTGPKLMIAMISISLYAIKTKMPLMQAFMGIVGGSIKDETWSSLENEIAKRFKQEQIDE